MCGRTDAHAHARVHVCGTARVAGRRESHKDQLSTSENLEKGNHRRWNKGWELWQTFKVASNNTSSTSYGWMEEVPPRSGAASFESIQRVAVFPLALLGTAQHGIHAGSFHSSRPDPRWFGCHLECFYFFYFTTSNEKTFCATQSIQLSHKDVCSSLLDRFEVL